jgi:uncharacterized protein (TIGR02246 family)
MNFSSFPKKVKEESMSNDGYDVERLRAFAARYAEAWCSQDPDRVAGFFGRRGSLCVNGGEPAIGRAAIAEVARGFMTDFPDMTVSFDELRLEGGVAYFHWTLTGTKNGPAGTGRPVRIGGYERWEIGDDELIARSEGHFDAAEYQRQLRS